MSDYTPTTAMVRDLYALSSGTPAAALAEFDRWLAEVKAAAWDEGFHAGYCEGRHGFNPDVCTSHENPYTP